MKKLIAFCLILIAGISANAEKGDVTLGLHFYDNPKIYEDCNAVGGGVSIRYSFTDNLRAKLMGSVFHADDFGGDIELDVQWVFNLSDNFVVYPAVGIGVVTIPEMTKFSCAVGPGIEYNFDENWGINFEAKAQFCNGGVGIPLSLGVAYTF